MTDNIVEVARNKAVATVSINRPERHNALNPQVVGKLTDIFRELSGDSGVRVIILTGKGRSFCAGADISYMVERAGASYEESLADGQAIFDLMTAVAECPRPVVGRINGAAFGGGLGLVSCCDIAIAANRAKFGFSEVRLGLVPAVISPFVLARIGSSAARELFLTGERFDAQRARDIGLVQQVVSEDQLDGAVDDRVQALLGAAPGALAAAKALIGKVSGQDKASLRTYTTDIYARRRSSEEGREGLTAFLEKRDPWWRDSG